MQRSRSNQITSGVIFILCLLAFSCDGCGGSSSQRSSNPVPLVLSITPDTVLLGSAALSVTITGSNFVSGSQVQWNGSPLLTTATDATQLRATIPASALSTATAAQVSVVNPGGMASNAVNFTVANPVPVLGSVSPSALTINSAPVILAVAGNSFVAASVVRLNGADRTTRFIDAGSLQAALLPSDLYLAQSNALTVFTPGPGGGTTAAIAFVVSPNGVGAFAQANLAESTTFPAAQTSAIQARSSTSAANSTITLLNPPGTLPGPGVVDSTGRYVAFSGELISGYLNGIANYTNPSMYLRDTCIGAAGTCNPNTTLVSVSTTGTMSWGTYPGVSPGGRFVAFSSNSLDLVTGSITTVIPGVFVRDTCTGAVPGCAPHTWRASSDTGDTVVDRADFSSVSANGRYTFFFNLGAGGGDQRVTLADSCLGIPQGCTPSWQVIATPASDPRMSDDARILAFVTVGAPQVVMVHDTCIGTVLPCTPQTLPVSVNMSGQPVGLGAGVEAVSRSGRFVTFSSTEDDLVVSPCRMLPQPFNRCVGAVYLRDTCFGASASCQPSTIRVSVADDGEEASFDSGLSGAQVSDDGRFVLFDSQATNLIHPSDPNTPFITKDGMTVIQLYMRDTCWNASGSCVPHTYLVSAALDGSPANGQQSIDPSMSSDGSVVVFFSDATNLLPNTAVPAGYNLYLAHGHP